VADQPLTTIRRATAADAPRILQLERELFGADAWTPGLLAEELGGTGRHYLVVEQVERPAQVKRPKQVERLVQGERLAQVEHRQVIAYAGIWVSGEAAEVMTIGVDPTTRRHGIGQRLMRALIDIAIQNGAQEMFLEVQTDNEPALALYEKLGFDPLVLRKRYYGTKDAYTMRLVLR